VAGAARPPRALSIAGSDSGGGAGIQADLKAFARCGVHGMTAITAITAQNTVGVEAVLAVEPEMIVAQVRAVAGDIGVDAVKVGMLGTPATARAVAAALAELAPDTPVVVDPVMVAESGARLLEAGAERVLVDEILPRATVITPNLPEARTLVAVGRGDPQGAQPERDDAEALLPALHALGPAVVVITGGHGRTGEDLFFDGSEIVAIPGERHPDGAAHGSGCTHSAVLAAQLARGETPLAAARVARALAGDAVARGLRDLGRGAGPVDVLDLVRLGASVPSPDGD
jgi:hydroxymethylpyrimidine/phosphomethylpyrimidine kinase